MKTYTADIVEADDGSGDAILEFPEDFIADQQWETGDTLSFKLEDGVIVLKNLTKEIRDGK
jgi:hypothetical protein